MEVDNISVFTKTLDENVNFLDTSEYLPQSILSEGLNLYEGEKFKLANIFSDSLGIGKQYYALGFDEDYVSVPSDPSLQDPDYVTISMWINADKLGVNFRALIQKNGWQTYARINAGRRLYWLIKNKAGTGSVLVPARYVSENVWTHLTFVASVPDNFQAIYKNGSLAGSQGIAWTGELAWDESYPVQIGTGPNTPFDGKIDEVRIYDRALSESEINEIYDAGRTAQGNDVVTSGLQGYWAMDEGSGDTAYDYSDNNNNGTIYGANWTKTLKEAGLLTSGIKEIFENENFGDLLNQSGYISLDESFSNIDKITKSTSKLYPEDITLEDVIRKDFETFLEFTENISPLDIKLRRKELKEIIESMSLSDVIDYLTALKRVLDERISSLDGVFQVGYLGFLEGEEAINLTDQIDNLKEYKREIEEILEQTDKVSKRILELYAESVSPEGRIIKKGELDLGELFENLEKIVKESRTSKNEIMEPLDSYFKKSRIKLKNLLGILGKISKYPKKGIREDVGLIGFRTNRGLKKFKEITPLEDKEINNIFLSSLETLKTKSELRKMISFKGGEKINIQDVFLRELFHVIVRIEQELEELAKILLKLE